MTELNDILTRELIDTYGLSTFVETGCYKGDGIQTAINFGLYSIASCDINLDHVNACVERFRPYEGHEYIDVRIAHSPSDQFLASKLVAISSINPTLFFLDAHLPGMYGTDSYLPSNYMPIIDELKAISRLPYVSEHVVVVDDMRIINSDDNPRWCPGETICCEPVTDISIADAMSILESTHDCKLVSDYEGYLIFTPKA